MQFVRNIQVYGDGTVSSFDVEQYFHPREEPPPTTIPQGLEIIGNWRDQRRFVPGSQVYGATLSYYNQNWEHAQRGRSAVDRVLSLPDPITVMEEVKNYLEVMLRAEKLLLDVLGKKSYDAYKVRGFIPVKSKKFPEREYQFVPYGRVRVFEKGIRKMELCVVPRGEQMPEQDILVIKKLMLQGDEEEFLKTAIKWDVAGGQSIPNPTVRNILDSLVDIFGR